ncbi:MAG: hypothetical protein IJ761_00305 [Bacteroidales bacterium]|nr:hypothetical protein [Bacteroidales bacterium]
MKKIIVVLLFTIISASAVMAQSRVAFKWHGFYSVLDYSHGFNVNRSVDTITANMLSFVAGYQFRKEAGVGVGVTYFADTKDGFTQMPFFIELRSHYLNSRITPYSAFQLGYCIPMGTERSEPPVTKIESGGVYFGAELGARFAIERSFAIGIHVGFKALQSTEIVRRDAQNVDAVKEVAQLNVLDFGISLHF